MQFCGVVVSALLLAVPGVAVNLRSGSLAAPDVESAVLEQSQENIHIADSFWSQEQQDDKLVSELGLKTTKHFVTALDKDMKTKMLVQVHSAVESKGPAIQDPCGNIQCGALKCPGGFTVTNVEGHCCPYCVNPDIQLEDAVTGATGSHGGTASTFCKDVWCFPTLCTKAESNPSDGNGQCCPTCPSL